MNPHALYFEDFSQGQEFCSPARTVTESDIIAFAGLTGDYNPIHTDEVFARDTVFGSRIAHGLLGLTYSVGLLSRLGIIDGTIVAFLGLEWKFVKPMFPGDTISVKATVRETRPSKSQPDKGLVKLDVVVDNHQGEKVQEGNWTFLMASRVLAPE